ncbi:MAG: peptidylprolyl isomerase [Mariniphaga sp.]|nr:peptidylprolyl isomerase [Mariniphaga sp.]
MRRFISVIILFSIVYSMVAQNKEVMLTIDGRQFSKEEFVRIYQKNNSNLLEESDKKSPEEYLDLFVNFKLKVIEAENLKMDTIQSFINELETYRKELAAPYLTDVSFNEKLVADTYQRMVTEVKASHILVAIPNNQAPEDTLLAYNKIMDVRNKILNGLEFKDAAFEYSEDPSAKSNRGDLGYFSAFQMVFPFEEAAYKTPVGEISMPVRSNYGYHLLKVDDKRDAKGEIKVAHIMKSFPQNTDNSIMKTLRMEIDSIYKQLKNGADFAELAKKYSDDKNSSVNGGEMAWFSSGRMISDFANPAFALEKNGDYTEPIVTQFGFHIIKRLDHRPVKTFDEVKSEIERRIKSDPARSVHSKSAFVGKLKSEYGFQVNEKNVKNVKNNTYLIKVDPNNSLTDQLFLLDGTEYTIDRFFTYTIDNYPALREFEESTFNKYLNEWVEYELTSYEDSKLEDKYPDFKYLMQEYHDGILLFNLSDEKIWSFASTDSIGLEAYYKRNTGKYMWGERFKGLIVKCMNIETREEADKYFSEGMTVQEVLDLTNSEEEKVQIEEGAWEKNSNPIVNFYVWNGEKPENFNEELEFIRGDKIGSESKLLNEARGLYLSDYQNYLETEWVKELRSKYKIKVNKKLLKAINNVSN